ncbi:hypothetical protein [Paracidovorax wautersii]|uniref:Uncharacterized protein n=1 Tax=Paracidovorax wautersii TaxID=1177982 RepID=A0ABU1IEI3_9BURK|nr:hypothetical protein [Paracidovorax wautersii]MDR6215592.1 hypothetical protein [Paracidovorax wautersii]
MTPYPPSDAPSVEETLLTLDHLLGKMERSQKQHDEALRAHLERLQAAIGRHVPGEAADAALPSKALALGYRIQECAEWQRNHQHAAEQYLNAIQVLTEHVHGLYAPPPAALEG